MEPLAKENKKLKEAMNHSEKNIQRAQRERYLAESNAWDLENQKAVLSEHLAIAKEQLWSKSEQLTTASTQLKDASEQLEKLQKVSEEKKATDLEVIGGGYAEGLSEVETQRLEDEVEDVAKKLAGDIDLFRETDGSGKAQ
ncbi:uncharacterized protein [Miscanthus floridulus]|uniref:uncharacterized protein n=1 Tax=Miscanthus floridulus TaxID=154761 RepID=UPI003459E3C9